MPSLTSEDGAISTGDFDCNSNDVFTKDSSGYIGDIPDIYGL